MHITLRSSYDVQRELDSDSDSDSIDLIDLYLGIDCPKCCKMTTATGDPNDSYNSGFVVSCNKCGCFMGIKTLKGIENMDKGYSYTYRAELVEFTHYNKKNDYHYDTYIFKELDQKENNGDTVWVEFKPHKYFFDNMDEIYNQTFLVKTGDFHFGFD